MFLIYAALIGVVVAVIGGFAFLNMSNSGAKRIKETLAATAAELKKMEYAELETRVIKQPEQRLAGGIVLALQKEIIPHDDNEIMQVTVTVSVANNPDLQESTVVTKMRAKK